jgi:hypothetical protein
MLFQFHSVQELKSFMFRFVSMLVFVLERLIGFEFMRSLHLLLGLRLYFFYLFICSLCSWFQLQRFIIA